MIQTAALTEAISVTRGPTIGRPTFRSVLDRDNRRSTSSSRTSRWWRVRGHPLDVTATTPDPTRWPSPITDTRVLTYMLCGTRSILFWIFELLTYFITDRRHVVIVYFDSTVQLSGVWPARDTPTVYGGPLTGLYELAQVHFHWGADNDAGSEHTVANHRWKCKINIRTLSI